MNATASTMRVMTWNLWWRFGSWEARRVAILAELRMVQPDVVMLQEVWGEHGGTLADWLAAELGWFAVATPVEYVGSNGVSFHNAIVSRWPLIDIEVQALPDSRGEPGHRRLLFASARSPFGAWPVACTHLDYRFDQSATRELQCRAVCDAVAARRVDPDVELPVVLGADLNAVPDSDEVRLLTGRRAAHRPNLVFSDCWEQLGEGSGYTWRSDNPYRADTAWPNRRIDYLLVSWPRPKPLGNPKRVWLAGLEPIDGVMPSDHAAVVADLVTTAQPAGAG
jgi:endonuclease/exonuclease/phosphatase family metal-dependent hydrolase